MKIIKISQISGIENTMDLDVTPLQMERFDNRLKNGEYVQTIFPHLTSEEREFILTGVTPEEWNQLFN